MGYLDIIFTEWIMSVTNTQLRDKKVEFTVVFMWSNLAPPASAPHMFETWLNV